MPRILSTERLAALGSIKVADYPSIGAGEVRLPRTLYSWHPSALLADRLPSGFEMPILAIARSDGMRMFREVDSARAFIAKCMAAGLAILERLNRLTREERLEYQASAFIYQYVLDTHAHLDCNFSSKQQLIIKRGSRSDADELDVLPIDLGIDRLGHGSRWSIERLWREGQTALQAAQYRNVSSADIIAHGLLVAALQNPLDRRKAEVRCDVRRALFDSDDHLAAPRRRLVANVKDRLCRLLDTHLDDSTADFNQWFFPEGGRNWPRAIARQPGQPGGVLAKEEVTGALLHLVWDAYGKIAECLGAFARAFLAVLPTPLSTRERKSFDFSMMPHRHFGGLPRLLVMERVEFLKPVLSGLWQNPGDRALSGALYRLLNWYPEMVRKRREADRLAKQRANPRRRQASCGEQWLQENLTEDGVCEDGRRGRRRSSKRGKKN